MDLRSSESSWFRSGDSWLECFVFGGIVAGVSTVTNLVKTSNVVTSREPWCSDTRLSGCFHRINQLTATVHSPSTTCLRRQSEHRPFRTGSTDRSAQKQNALLCLRVLSDASSSP